MEVFCNLQKSIQIEMSFLCRPKKSTFLVFNDLPNVGGLLLTIPPTCQTLSSNRKLMLIKIRFATGVLGASRVHGLSLFKWEIGGPGFGFFQTKMTLAMNRAAAFKPCSQV